VLALRILAVLLGTAMVLAAIVSAVKTIVMPRARSSAVTRTVFLAMRQVFELVVRAARDLEQRDRILSGYAPVSLIATLATWLVLVLVGFTLIFWGLEDAGWLHAFDVSGSSLFTLGFTTSQESWTSVLVFLEAGIGLFLLALMISYLPTLYSVYARREVGIAALEVRAGSPPSAREMIWRYRRLERLPEIHEVWIDWQRWFAEVEESHSSYPALVFFRSSHADHSWVTSAGAVLDAAALTVSSVDIPRDVEAEFCIRAGYLCLREIAGYFDIPFDPDPRSDDPISIAPEEFSAMLDLFEEEGVPLKPDREQAWRDFAGWRVNYDAPLLALARLTNAPPAEWSTDRSEGPRIHPPVVRRRSRTR
jgi:hypothetical protein